MRKVFKKFVVGLLIAATILTFTACNGDDGSGGGSGGGRKTTVNFYTWGNNNDQQMMGEIKAAFETKYPNYKVEIEFAAGGVYSDSVIQRIGGGNAPDIFHVEPGSFSFFAKNGLLENLSDKFSDELKADLFELNDGYKYDATTGTIGAGDQYGVIKDWGSTFSLIFNKGLINDYNKRQGKYQGVAGNDTITIPEVTVADDGTVTVPDPLKWSEFLDIAKKLTINKGGTGAVYGTVMDYSYDIHIQEFIQMTGDSLYHSDGSKMDINDGVREAFQFFTDLQKGEDAPCPTASSQALGGEMFANGTIATVFYGSWAVPSYDWVGKGIDFGIAPAPMPDSLWNGNQAPEPMMTSSPVGMAIYSETSSRKKEAAVAFLDFFMKEGSKILARRGFNIPTLKSVAENVYINPEEVNNPNLVKYNRIFLELGKNYTVMQDYNPRITTAALKDKFDIYIGNWLSGKIGTFDAFLNTLKSEVDLQLAESA